MPGRDQTGPAGMGPMTGRAAGSCAGNTEPTPVVRGRERGFGGRGFGFGAGRRRRFRTSGFFGRRRSDAIESTGTSEPQIDDLRAQIEYCKETLERIQERIEELR